MTYMFNTANFIFDECWYIQPTYVLLSFISIRLGDVILIASTEYHCTCTLHSHSTHIPLCAMIVTYVNLRARVRERYEHTCPMAKHYLAMCSFTWYSGRDHCFCQYRVLQKFIKTIIFQKHNSNQQNFTGKHKFFHIVLSKKTPSKIDFITDLITSSNTSFLV